jgi:hypothetical protein
MNCPEFEVIYFIKSKKTNCEVLQLKQSKKSFFNLFKICFYSQCFNKIVKYFAI